MDMFYYAPIKESAFNDNTPLSVIRSQHPTDMELISLYNEYIMFNAIKYCEKYIN